MRCVGSFVVILLLFVFSCQSTKRIATPQQLLILDNLVSSQAFVIESDWVFPQTTNSLIAIQNTGLLGPGNSASRISLIGNANELRLNNGKVSSKLPYFGEMQSASSYNGTSNSIMLEGQPKDYKVTKNDNSSYTITFEAKSDSENFNVIIHLYPSLKSEIIVNSAKRFSIRYSGVVRAILE